MRILQFDEYEFDAPSTEEALRIAAAPRRQFPTAAEFLAACPRDAGAPAFSAGRAVPWQSFERRGAVSAHLSQFAPGVDLPESSASVIVLADEWSDLEVVVETPDRFVWYQWQTTA